MSAVRGTFADFKTVKTRGQCQAIIEFPIEDADHVLAVLGGIPQPSKEQWVGVAPISGVAESKDDAPDEPVPMLDETDMSGHVDRKPKGGPLSQQAGILCNDNNFLEWLFRKKKAQEWLYGDLKNVPYGSAAAEIVRRLCGLQKSRAELDINDGNNPGAIIWSKLVNAYHRDRNTPPLEQMEAIKR